MGVVGEAVDESRAALEVEHREVRLGDPREVERGEAQGQRLRVVRAEGLVHDRPVLGLAHDEAIRPRLALDVDLLLDHLERPPVSIKLVLTALDPLDEEVHDIRHHVGERPRDVVVLPHRHARQARQAGAAAEPIAEVETHLVGDPGHAGREVRVARHQRSARRRAVGADRPIVGARGLDGEADHLTHLRDLLCELEAVAAPPRARREHHRVAARVAGVQAGGELGAELSRHLRPEQLALPVGRQAVGQKLRHRQGVGRSERLEPLAQDLKLRRQGAIGSGRVHARAVRVQPGADPRLELGGLGLGDAAQPQRPDEAIGDQARGPGDLRQPAGADAAVEVDLPEAILSVAEALAEPQVEVGLGADVRHAPAVARDLDRPLDAGHPQIARGSRQRPPEELVPEAGRRAPREPPERGARERGPLCHRGNVHAPTLGNNRDCRIRGEYRYESDNVDWGGWGLVVEVVRQPALGVELLQVRLHHERGGRAELRRDVVPGGVEKARTRALAGGRAPRAAFARDPGGGRCTR